MEKNPKFFYSYVKSMTKSRGKVGPFINEKGEVIKNEPAEILQTQYQSVWTTPRDEYSIKDRKKYFMNDGSDEKSIKYVHFCKLKILKAINDLRMDAAPGPDGIPPFIIKTFKH